MKSSADKITNQYRNKCKTARWYWMTIHILTEYIMQECGIRSKIEYLNEDIGRIDALIRKIKVSNWITCPMSNKYVLRYTSHIDVTKGLDSNTRDMDKAFLAMSADLKESLDNYIFTGNNHKP